MLSCNYCDKQFSAPSQYNIHVRSHTKEKPFSCEECGKEFGQKSNLKKHQFVHTPKQFCCLECQKQFTTQQNLQRHKNNHTQTLTFSCRSCGKGLRTKQNLQKHIRNVHAMKTMKSITCDKTCYVKYKIKQEYYHRIDYHSENIQQIQTNNVVVYPQQNLSYQQPIHEYSNSDNTCKMAGNCDIFCQHNCVQCFTGTCDMHASNINNYPQ